ncbi:MAG: UDP-N-acetylmuramoyl-tripeptide--D-alanyl-D-alanine ligase [Gammaproteobacteria bacterium]|nr:UDP-N-acetylmuramoyl-tripeptide--D-alanyl-D-alanine ligase [Gammaproteobacteria bacterium]
MLNLSVMELASVLQASCCNLPRSAETRRVIGVCTDSRRLQPGNLFVALRGPNFDGHRFVASAAEAGAVAALVDHCVQAELPQVQVDDTLRALGALAADWRARHTPRALGVTGSNGKTTVKNMLATILAGEAPTLATRGNLNNEIGVPLTLFGLDSSVRYLVVEMGANHVGEIRYLAGIARPQVGVITQIAPAHIEGFGSVENVARAKAELFEALPQDGVAVVNAEDRFQALLRERAGGRRCLSFGTQPQADVSVSAVVDGNVQRLQLRTPIGLIDARLALPGRHNAMNAAAACAAAIAAGVSASAISEGLSRVVAEQGRLQTILLCGGQRLLDDTYNANPESLRAGLEVLQALSGQHWLVLGEMGELGEAGIEYHRQVAGQARAHGVRRLFTLGEMARHASDAFGEGALHFDDRETLSEYLRERLTRAHEELDEPVNVLVKGSRVMRMEQVVEVLRTEGRTCCSH